MTVYKDRNKDFSIQNEGASVAFEKDLRYLPRWEVDNRILLRREKEITPHECHSKDINATGVCLRTTEDIKPDTMLNLTIYLAEDIDPIHVYGKVLWKKELEGQHHLGVRFEQMSDNTGNLIFQYAFEYKKEDLIKRWYHGFA